MFRPPLYLAIAAVLSLASPAVAETDDAGRTVHTVYAQQTLGKIARRYRVSIDELCRVNGIRRGARLRPGQKLVVPDDKYQETERRRAATSNRWQDYVQAPRKRGYVVLESPTKKWRGFVLGKRGSVLPKAQEAVERILASWRTGKKHPIDPRLVQLVVHLSDTFGGRPIRVVSGYREKSFAMESKHKVGRAFDFSVPGIPNAAIRDYLRTLPKVGVGYYPNSTHVHLDVREASAYWVDTAHPGEPPKYLHRLHPGDATPDGTSASASAADDDEAAPPPEGAQSEATEDTPDHT